MSSQPVIIIAEAGVNHNGSIELARKLIDAAADAGADYVKFQTFIAENSLSISAKKAEYQINNTGKAEETQLEMVKKLELSVEAHQELFDYSKQRGIKFSSTAFDSDSVDLLSRFDLDFFKIPSGEITNLPQLKKIAAQRKPVILSTGMANLGEVETCINILEHEGLTRDQITVLHCNTEYPTPMADVNLSAMNTIGNSLKVSIGYSDHTLGIEIPIAAVALGATVIEKHFTLDTDMEGPDHKASLEPVELKAMVRAIRNIEQALGDGIKRPSASEAKNIAIARKSIHLASDLSEGHILTERDLRMKRPGTGISPMEMDRVIGKKLRMNMAKDQTLFYEHIS